MKYEDLTSKIIKAAFMVHNTLGYGFLEKVYKNAIAFEIKYFDLDVEIEKAINVYHKNHKVGEYFADLLVNNQIIIEVKSVTQLHPIHEVQLVNYLKATENKVGLLINLGKSVDIKRKILY